MWGATSVILTDKMKSLEIRVLLYTGNMDMMVHTMGMNRVVRDLKWNAREEFDSSGSVALVVPGVGVGGYYGQGEASPTWW